MPYLFGGSDDPRNLCPAPARFNQVTLRRQAIRALREAQAGHTSFRVVTTQYEGEQLAPNALRIQFGRTIDGEDRLISDEVIPVVPPADTD